ncbi:MAG: ATP-dependent RecD-like DNA helicase [Desulfobacteraceae bacterium]|jgi:exodeoxyribonuclease V alpha subunit
MQDKEPLVELEGQIHKIKFNSNETGYSVLSMHINGYKNPVIVVGNLGSPSPGEFLKISGKWSMHPKFGKQFKAKTYTIKNPVSILGIEKFLGSGLIKGIGPKMAERIVNRFGKNSLEIIDHHPEELGKIDGVGPKRISMIKEAWYEQKHISDLMIFLQAYGIGSGPAIRIFKRYGQGAISILKKNPYKLASEVFGIGFRTADNIAEKLGFSKDSSIRLESGVIFVSNQLSEEGHVYYPLRDLTIKCREILEASSDEIQKAIGRLVLKGELLIYRSLEESDESGGIDESVYLKKFYIAEKGVAENLMRIFHAKHSLGDFNIEKAVKWVQSEANIHFAENQILAIKTAVQSKLMVITGGPGTGKTTVINAIIRIFKELNATIQLAAPTGRAANRMSETTSCPAKTIHRLLEYTPNQGIFRRNRDNPLDADVLILDEASMIDTRLMSYLLEAVPESAVVIMVGDINQLPSVGAGNVLGDIIDSGEIPCIELNEIFRQAEGSNIILYAHSINNGIMPAIESVNEPTDFYFIEQDDPKKVLNMIIELVARRIPNRFGFDLLKDIQVISPMHKGIVGTDNLNKALQDAVNPSESKLTKGYRNFRINDKVMQTKNNYEKEIYNGDTGKIIDINPENQKVNILFDRKKIEYEYNEMDELTLAYAISVHKSQGNEYPAVILPLLTQHYIMLQRNLIYTAITRGKNLVVIAGSKKAFEIGIKNDRISKRYTNLSQMIKKTNH